MSVQFICKLPPDSCSSKTNFRCEQGHLDNVNTGQQCTRESAQIFPEPGVCQGAFPHDLFIWGRLWMSIIPGRSEETHKSQEGEAEVVCRFTAPGLLCMFSVRDVGEHLEHHCSLPLSLFIQGGFAACCVDSCSRKHPLSSQTGSKALIYISAHLFSIITFN